jgi:hypothetical protein
VARSNKATEVMSESSPLPPNVESALQYASNRGWALVPMRQKKFYTRHRVRSATRDPNIIKQWGRAESIGMACGEPSGTDVLDINDAEAFAVLGFDPGAMAASTLVATTPRGGLHLFYEYAGRRSRLFPWGDGGRPGMRLNCHRRRGDGGGTIELRSKRR